MRRVRVLLAEDHEVVASELCALLQSECDVVATVSDGKSLIRSAFELHPDVIVADISMPVLDGLAAAKQVMDRDRANRIVFVTVHADEALVERAFEVGALGYVLKITAGEDLLSAVRAAARDERYLSPLLNRASRDGQTT